MCEIESVVQIGSSDNESIIIKRGSCESVSMICRVGKSSKKL